LVDIIIITTIIIIIIIIRVIPVTIGATGTISKSFRKYVSSVPGNHEVRQLQKTAILGTAHILRKVLT
jgi:Sec-independent protein translocase protein TatA